jgi:hypothetical protein
MNVKHAMLCTLVAANLLGGELWAANQPQAATPQAASGTKATFSIPSSARRAKGRPGQRLKQIDVAAQQRDQKRKELLAEEAKQLQALAKDRTLTRQQKMEKSRLIHQQTEEQVKTQMSPEELKNYEAGKERSRILRAKLKKQKEQTSAPK